MKNRRVISLSFSLVPCLAVLVVLLVLCNSARAQASMRYVAVTGLDRGDCKDAGNPCRTVQYAVDVAAEADLIKVAAGVYSGVHSRVGLTQTVYISKTVTIRGGYDTTFVEPPDPDANPTILDAQGQGRVLYITGAGRAISPTVSGLRITGGRTGLLNTPSNDGGGCYVTQAAVTLENNRFISNTAAFGGGVALVEVQYPSHSPSFPPRSPRGVAGSSVALNDPPYATLQNNEFISNTASTNGGGVYIVWGNVALVGNTVTGNNTGSFGGGIYVEQSDGVTLNGNNVRGNMANYGGGLALGFSEVALSSNVIENNRATYGGGLDLGGTDAMLVNNVIVANEASMRGSGLLLEGGTSYLLHNTVVGNYGGDGSGLHVKNFVFTGDATVWLTNTMLVSHTVGITVAVDSAATLEATLWGNSTWGNDSDWAGGGTIITGTVNYWGDPAFKQPDVGNYHIAENSAAKDAGVNAGVNTDIDGQSRPYGSGYDLGADEFHPFSHIYLPLILRNGPWP